MGLSELAPRFCLPFNGDSDFIRGVIRDHAPQIHEFYGTDEKYPSARHAQWHSTSDTEFAHLVDFIRSAGCGFNYLLNSPAPEAYVHQEQRLFKHLEHSRSLGVTTITCSIPIFATEISGMGFEVSSSVLQRITTEVEVRHLERLGYTRIVVAEDCTRMLPTLRKLRRDTNSPLEVLVNSTCLMGCPFRMTHCGLDGTDHPQLTDVDRERTKRRLGVCKNYWSDDLVHFLKGSWLRPQDTAFYVREGISLFKIAGRDKSTAGVRKAVDAYLSGSRGSVCSFLKPDKDLLADFGIPDISCQQLDAFFDFFFSSPRGCDGACSACGHCEAWATRLR
ncbi:MAG: hypothetical protein AB2L09_07395 [Coriobacteriia bacterium]